MTVLPSVKSAGVMLVATLASGWLGSSLSQQTAPAPPATRLSASRQAEVPAVPRTERLRERRVEPPSPAGGRNPFVFGTHAPTRSITSRDRAASPSEVLTAPAPPPVFKLSGIASATENGGTVLTAIVIDNGGMVFVKAGDKLSRGYSVVRIEEMSITIADADGVTQTLRLP